jgi:hypothetical protein
MFPPIYVTPTYHYAGERLEISRLGNFFWRWLTPSIDVNPGERARSPDVGSEVSGGRLSLHPLVPRFWIPSGLPTYTQNLFAHVEFMPGLSTRGRQPRACG